MRMSAKDTVQQFCDVMAKKDVELLRPLLADDVVYQNVGMPAVQGLDAVLDAVGGFFAIPCFAFETVNAVAEGDVVMNERLDMVAKSDGTPVGLPVMGTFVVRDGKITRWTDYWDMGLLQKLMSGEDAAALVPAPY